MDIKFNSNPPLILAINRDQYILHCMFLYCIAHILQRISCIILFYYITVNEILAFKDLRKRWAIYTF